MAALEAVQDQHTISTLQCLLLAQLFTIVKGDYTLLRHFRGLAVALSDRLGLHQLKSSQTYDVLEFEMSKKIFWTLFTLDR